MQIIRDLVSLYYTRILEKIREKNNTYLGIKEQ